MAEKESNAILVDEIDQHPATLAWRQINDKTSPHAIEVLQQQRKSKIYRLVEGISSGESIIAKRCVTKTGKYERLIYEEILPLLPVSQLHYYGSFQENDSYLWLFLEDAGRQRFSALDESHRLLVANWLGWLHHSVRQTAAATLLPQRDPDYHLELIQKGRDKIVKNLENPTLTPEYVDVLKRVLMQMETLESNWEKLAKFCQGLPQTMIHADFQPKNIRVKQGVSGYALYVIDWEMAGWGIPVVDLAPSRGMPSVVDVDLPTYLAIAREFWQNLDMPTLRFALHAGCILRRLAAIYWSSLEMAFNWVEGPVRDMEIFHKELSQAWQLFLRGSS